MDLKQLESFCTIVQTGSFAKAATKLQYAPSTITLHIQLLEEGLNASLFDRQGKNVILTEVGRVFYEEAKSVLHQMNRLQSSMRELVQEGTLQLEIGAVEPTASLRLPKTFQKLLQNHPKIKIRLETGGTLGLCERVRGGSLAFAITTPPPRSSNLIFEPMFKEPLTLLLSVNHSLSAQETIMLKDLEGLPFLLSETGCAYREEIERVLHLRGIQIRPKAEIGSGQAIKNCVQLGMGVALIPGLSVTHPPEGTVTRSVADEELSLVTGITYSPERDWRSIEREFYGLVKQDLRKQTF